MAETKMIRRAKVTLIRGKTYTIAGVKYIRNVPKTVKGSMCDEFKNNGRFNCVELESKPVKKKKKKETSSTKVKTDKKVKTSKKKLSKKKSKSSSKKKAKK